MIWFYYNYNLFYYGYGLNGLCLLVFFLSIELMLCKLVELNMIELENIINDIFLVL